MSGSDAYYKFTTQCREEVRFGKIQGSTEDMHESIHFFLSEFII